MVKKIILEKKFEQFLKYKFKNEKLERYLRATVYLDYPSPNIYIENYELQKNDCKLIIEIGVNHNGNMNLAKKMIDTIAKYEVDYIKFQSFLADELCIKEAKLASYQKKNLSQNISQLQMLKKYQLNYKDHLTLYEYCKKKKIKFVSSVFGYKSFNLYNNFETDFVKIPSGEINNIPFLKYLDEFNKNIILSTGMASKKEIDNAVNNLRKN